MRLRDAKKLHNDDQVTIKDSKEVVVVYNAYPHPTIDKLHLVEVMTSDGYKILTHRDVQ